MKRYFVIFCQLNRHKPQIYKTLNTINKKIKQNNQLTYQSFNSQIQAKQFLQPKILSYTTKLKSQHLIQKPKPNQQPQPKVQNLKQPIQQVLKVQSERPIQQALIKQQVKSLKSKQIIKQSLIKQQDQVKEDKSTQPIQKVQIKNENLKQPIQKVQVKKQQYKKPIQQTVIKSEKNVQKIKIPQIVIPQNLKYVYRQVLRYQGRDVQSFIKKPSKTHINPQQIYYGFFDGCSKGMVRMSGIGYLISSKNSQIIIQNSYNVGIQTNNASQYLALIYLMLQCISHGIKHIHIFGDSQLIVNGLKGIYQIKNPNIVQYSLLSKQLSKNFETFQIKHIHRQLNVKADKLSNEGYKKKMMS